MSPLAPTQPTGRARGLANATAPYLWAGLLGGAVGIWWLALDTLDPLALTGWDLGTSSKVVALGVPAVLLAYAVVCGFRTRPVGVRQALIRLVVTPVLSLGVLGVPFFILILTKIDHPLGGLPWQIPALTIAALAVLALSVRLRGVWPTSRLGRVQNVLTLLVVVVPVVPFAVAFARTPTALRRFAALDARLAQLETQAGPGRWERPVLRGEVIDGNADEAQAAAMREPIEGTMISLEQLPEEVFDMSPRELRALVWLDTHALVRLRAATQRSWSWAVSSVEAEALGTAPEPRPRYRAAVVLRRQAADAGPVECLRLGADIVRLGQDDGAGSGLAMLLTGSNIIELGVRTIGDCNLPARVEDRRASEGELRELVRRSQSPTGALARTGLVMAAKLRETVKRARGPLADAIVPQAADAMEAFLDQAAQWKKLTPLDYPALLREVMRRARAAPRVGNAILVHDPTPAKFPEYVTKDASAQAYLRTAVAYLDVAAIRAETGRLPDAPPSILAAEELRDPFSGTPLRWTPCGDKICLLSVGPNGHLDPTSSGGQGGDDIGWALDRLEPPPASRDLSTCANDGYKSDACKALLEGPVLAPTVAGFGAGLRALGSAAQPDAAQVTKVCSDYANDLTKLGQLLESDSRVTQLQKSAYRVELWHAYARFGPVLEQCRMQAAARFANLSAEGAGLGMVAITRGRFKPTRSDAVTVEPFLLDATEVTADAYAACVRAGGCTATKLDCDHASTYGVADKGTHPINCVDWAQADAYCRWIGRRLPTDAEWVWAARRQGEGTTYPWGEAEPGTQLCWKHAGTCAVASYPAGDAPGGVHDMAGNVAEWTSTRAGKDGAHVTRGGSWVGDPPEPAFELEANSWPLALHVTSRFPTLGFRCAR